MDWIEWQVKPLCTILDLGLRFPNLIVSYAAKTTGEYGWNPPSKLTNVGWSIKKNSVDHISTKA